MNGYQITKIYFHRKITFSKNFSTIKIWSHTVLYILICLSIYDRISLTNLKITHVFHFLLGFAENQRVLRFEIVFSSDNGDSDSRVQIMVLLYALLMIYVVEIYH